MTTPESMPAEAEEPPIDPRLLAIRARKAERARQRAEFAERRRYGVAARHRNKLIRNRRKDSDPS